MMRRIGLFSVVLAAGLSMLALPTDAQSRAQQMHRPADGIRGFAEACLTPNATRETVKAALAKHDVHYGISDSPQGTFPAGRYSDHPAFSAIPIATSCQVRIRGLWLSSADPYIAQMVAQAGFVRLESREGRERINGATVVFGASSGIYRLGNDRYVILVSQTQQPAGRTTELYIGRMRS